MSRRRSTRLKGATASVVLPDEIAYLDKELIKLTPDEDCMDCESQRTDETASVQSFSSLGSAKHEEENFDLKTDPMCDVDVVDDTTDQEIPTDPPKSTSDALVPVVTPVPTDPTNSTSDALVPREETIVKAEDVDTEEAIVPDMILTDKMITEEDQMHKETIKENTEEKQERAKLWDHMDESTREAHYNRLKYLLSKSNMYTEYLIARMKRQEEENKKKEQRAKRHKRKPDKDDGKEVRSSKRQKVEVKPANKKSNSKRNKNLTLSDDNIDSQESVNSSTDNGNKENILDNTQEINKLDEHQSENVEESGLEDQGMDMEEVNDDLAKVKKTVNGEKVLAGQPVMLTGGVLRDYQIEGYNWLKVLYENGVNGILADEMGLGKTIQCIALISHLMNMAVSGPYLVCAPLSTLPNWYSEFKRFSPEVPVILYHGSKDERTAMRKKICKAVEIHKNTKVFPVVITSYEVTMNDRRYLQNYSWKYLIVDEGHRIKNTHCRLIGALRMYKTTHRLLLTGTPLQNNLSELWSLLNFLLPEIFDDLGSFESWFDIERMESCQDADEQIVAHEQKNSILSMLHQILTPFMLRRLKADVSLSIPPKKEVLVYAPLTTVQQEYYKATVDRTVLNMIEKKKNTKPKVELNENGRPIRRTTKNRVNYESMFSAGDEDDEKKKWSEKEEEKLDEWVKDVTALQETRETSIKEPEVEKTSVINIRLQNIMMQLRKCCNHPYLLEYPLDPQTKEFKVDENLVAVSGKMMLLDRLLRELKARKHKVLLFSQMTKMLDVVEDFCYLRKYQYCRLDGSYKIEERQQEIASFNSDPEVFLFLLSTRAGGLGINLTAADTVIIYDSDWNPQCDLQAQDRCHRIGQTKPVVVYRLVTSNSIDQRIVERAAAKRKLEKMVIHKGKFKSGIDNFTTSLTPLSGQELLKLLKSKDHESVVRGGDVISDSEVELLLDRSDLMQKWSEMKRDKAEGVPAKTATKIKTKKKKTKPSGES